MGDRAVQYRRINRLPDDWGTAVNVQQMVYGNLGETSCSGVAFSRDEVTGASTPSGDFLPAAQGEDVVSGVRTPRDLSELADWMPSAHADLTAILRRAGEPLQGHAGHGVHGRGRASVHASDASAKRPGSGGGPLRRRRLRGAVAVRKAEAISTIDAASLDALLHPTFDSSARFTVLARGVAASPGAAKGTIVFTAPEAVEKAQPSGV